MFDPENPEQSGDRLRRLLERYAEALRPWAAEQAARMVREVDARDRAAWRAAGRDMGRALAEELESAPSGRYLRDREQATAALITSIPLEAAVRVRQLTARAATGGERAAAAVPEIMRSGDVARSRAELIARTETARTASLVLEARARHVGSPGYVWRTAEDADVRPKHRKLAGKFFKWDDPPVSGERGERAHAGQIYNCRCWPDPVIPDEPEERAA